MTTILISTYLIDVDDHYKVGHELSRLEANLLNSIWLKRFFSRVSYLATKHGMTEQELLSESTKLSSSLEIDIEPDSDPIANEALAIAKEQIAIKLAKLNLPLPPNIDLHARELAASPEIARRARIIVEAKLRAVSELIKGT